MCLNKQTKKQHKPNKYWLLFHWHFHCQKLNQEEGAGMAGIIQSLHQPYLVVLGVFPCGVVEKGVGEGRGLFDCFVLEISQKKKYYSSVRIQLILHNRQLKELPCKVLERLTIREISNDLIIFWSGGGWCWGMNRISGVPCFAKLVNQVCAEGRIERGSEYPPFS